MTDKITAIETEVIDANLYVFLKTLLIKIQTYIPLLLQFLESFLLFFLSIF